MELQLWIIGQIAVDAVLVGVLVWLIVAGNRRRVRDSEAQSQALQRSEEILAQMRDIVQELDGNLEEKRELTRRLLGRLDETIERAERRYEAYSDLLEATDSASTRDRVSLKGTQGTRESIQTLLDRGLTREEVSQRLGISRGEIDLFLKLGAGSSRT